MLKLFKRSVSPIEMLRHRVARLESIGSNFVVFRVRGRDGKLYKVPVNRDSYSATCPCEDRTGECWHIKKALMSYKRRVNRGELF